VYELTVILTPKIGPSLSTGLVNSMMNIFALINLLAIQGKTITYSDSEEAATVLFRMNISFMVSSFISLLVFIYFYL
jgi:hypothetical protein